jgi:hypothetical protein
VSKKQGVEEQMGLFVDPVREQSPRAPAPRPRPVPRAVLPAVATSLAPRPMAPPKSKSVQLAFLEDAGPRAGDAPPPVLTDLPVFLFALPLNDQQRAEAVAGEGSFALRIIGPPSYLHYFAAHLGPRGYVQRAWYRPAFSSFGPNYYELPKELRSAVIRRGAVVIDDAELCAELLTLERYMRAIMKLMHLIKSEGPGADGRSADEQREAFYRAGGGCVCEWCGRQYAAHFNDLREEYLTVLCDGRRVKL